jgi:gliding motility-associated-like protein
MNHSTKFTRRQLLWCIAASLILFANAASVMAGSKDGDVKNLTREQLMSRYTFFAGDSLTGFDYEATYRNALEVSHISIERELNNYFGITEKKFVDNKFHIAEIEPQRPGRDYRNPLTPACANLDFEYGDWTGWNGGCGYNTNSNGLLTVTWPGIHDGALCNPVSACQYHTLCTTTCPNDGYGNGPGLPVVDPGGGNFSARLGGDQINLYEGFCLIPYQSYTYSAGEYIEQTVLVTTANALFTYSYQVVLEDAPHGAGEQPYFHAEVFDQFGNSISSCFEYYVQSLPNTGGPPPGFFASPVFGYSYLPWTQNSINLTSQLGAPVTVRFTAAGCLYGGHSAHAYVDVSCSSVQIVVTNGSIPCNGTTTLVAPPAAGGTYTWSGPGIVGSNTSQVVTVNVAGNYTVTIHPTTGCDYTLSTDVTASPNINGSVNSTNVRCNGANTGVAWTTPIGGTAPFTYAWTPSGSTTQTVSNLLAGTYTTTITDVNGCTYTANTTITQPNALAAPAITTNLSCYNVPTGSAIVNPNGGTPGYSYTWSTSPAQHGQTATNLAAGNYTVTVTDANSCTRVQAVQITQPTQLVAPTVPTPVSCNGGNNGSATVNPNGGTAPYTYLWSTAATTATANNLAAGTYTVTVTDNHGCTRVSIVAVTQPTPVNTANAGVTPVACFGGNNGQAIVAANGGTAPYTYLWSPTGGTAVTANTLSVGNYTCTVTDNHGCSVLQPFTITQPTAVVAAIPSHTDVSCNGGNNGTALGTGSGGTAPYTYLWSSGSSTATANNLAAGNYTVTVTDAHGCTQTTAVVISEPTALTNNTSNTNVSCYAGNDASAWATPGGGTPPYVYLWTPTGQTTQTATNLAATNVMVRVTDANGCQIVTNLVITQPLLLTASMNPPTHVSCNSLSDGTASVAVNYGTPPYSYLWSPSAQTNSTASNLAAGTYTVIVTDANGCTTTKTVVINEPALLTAVTNSGNVNCNGGNNGTASVAAGGGTTPYTYLWSSGNTTATANNLTAGNYTVTVTDAHGCTQTATTSIAEPTLLIAGTSPPTNITCFGYNNGSAFVTANGGVTPYTYQWSPSAQATQTAINLGPNNYTVTVMDAHGCTQTAYVDITEPPQVTVIASPPTNVTCFGLNNGSAFATPGGGTPPYTYNWSPSAQTAQTATNLGPNNYTVKVTDANGCSISDNVLITEPPALTAVPAHTNVSCFGLSDGSASVTSGGGVSPYAYLWNPSGNTTASANGIPAGPYVVTITDVNGCTLTATATVTEPTQLLSDTTGTTNVICHGQNNGAVTVVPAGGTIPYTYLWSTSATTATANNLFAGTYTATVLDAHGCLTYSTATITQPPLLIANIPWHTDNLCYGDQQGTAFVNVVGGIQTYQYAWSPSGGTNATAVGMGAGNYTVIITDVNACTTKQLVQITQPPLLTMSVNTPPIICIGQNTDITTTVGGGTPPYNYVWDNGGIDSTQNVNPDTSTTYAINVTDANGCTVPAQTITVNVYPQLTFSAIGPPSVCSGTVVTLSSAGSGGNGGPYTYTWSNGETTSSISLAITQDTTFNVTFSDGCSPSQQANVSVINNPVPIVNFSPWVTSGCAPLTVDFVDSTITVAGATYAWTLGDGTGEGNQNFTHVYPNPGVYDISLTVTTPANCTSDTLIPHVVEVFPLPAANFATSTDVVEYDYPFVDFSNYSSDADFWHWDFGDGSTDTAAYSPTHHYTDTGYYNIQLAVMNDHGCVDTINGRIYVRPEWSIFIPNNFTPNGDGINDSFNALGTNIIDYDMLIVDRWGAKIYHSESMGAPWNGTYFNNGKECQTDVYVYKIKARDIHGKMHTFIGHVTLWR